MIVACLAGVSADNSHQKKNHMMPIAPVTKTLYYNKYHDSSSSNNNNSNKMHGIHRHQTAPRSHNGPSGSGLTLSSPVVPNGYTTKCSKPCWSNPPFLFFFDIRALWRSVLSARVPERQKNKNGGLDQYGFEHFVV